MTDEFVKNAFAEAREALADDEYRAYERCFLTDDRGDIINMVAVMRTGVEKMERMLESIGDENRTIMAEYISNIIISVFHQGYTARMEDER